MADIVERIILDDSQYIGPLQNIIDSQKTLNDEIQETNEVSQGALMEASKGAEDYSEALAETAKKTIQQTKETERLKKQQDQYNESSRRSLKNFELFGISYTKVIGKLNEFRTSLRGTLSTLRDNIKLTTSQQKSIINLTGALQRLGISQRASRAGAVGLAKGFNVLKVAIASTGIGALVIGLGSLISFLKGTERGSNFLAKQLNRLKGVVELVTDSVNFVGEKIFDAFSNPKEAVKGLADTIKTILFDQTIGRIQSLATAISLLFKGEFKAAAKEAVDAVTGINNSVDKFATVATKAAAAVNETVKAADKLTAAQLRLKRANIDLQVDFAKTRAEIKKLNKDAEDVNLTFDKRLESARKANELEQGLLNRQIELKKAEIGIEKQRIALLSDDDKIEELQKVADLEVELFNLRESSLELQTTLSNKESAIRAQQAAEVQALRNEYQQLTSTLQDALFQIELDEADPITRLQKQQAVALKGVEDQINQFKEVALKLGLTPEEQQRTLEGYQKLAEKITSDFALEIEKIRAHYQGENIVQVDPLKPEDLIDIPDRGITIPGVTIEEPEDAFDPDSLLSGLSELTELSEAFSDTFNLAVQSIEQGLERINDGDYFGAFQAGFAGATQSIVAGVNTQIKAIEDANKARQQQINQLQSDLKKEEELQKDGLANNADFLKDAIDNETRLQEEALKEKEALAQKAQRIQLLNDTIQQSSSLITAGSNIFKAFSSIPFAGIPLAIGTIATMLGAFAKLKIDAFNATKLFRGTKGEAIGDYFGPVEAGGKSDKTSSGYAITDAASGRDTGVRIGGNEILVDEANSIRHKGFFKDLSANPAYFKDLDISEIVRNRNRPNISIKTKQLEAASMVPMNGRFTKGEMVEALKEVLPGQINRLIDERQKDLNYIPTENGYIVKDKKGRTVQKMTFS